MGLVSTIADVEKMLAIGYRLVASRARTRNVFSLAPPFTDVEYAIRLGFVRRDVGAVAAPLHVAEDAILTPISIEDGATRLVEQLGEKLYEIRGAGTPLRRIVIQFPCIPDLLQRLATWGFYEDLIWREVLSQELELPMLSKGADTCELVPGLDVSTFLEAWRILKFFCVVNIALLKKHQDDPVVLRNSLMRITQLEQLRDVLQAASLTPEQSTAFLDLISVDVTRLRYLDIQYTPFLVLNPTHFQLDGVNRTTPVEVVHSPAVVATANVLPNLLRAHGIRIAANAESFVTLAANTLKKVIPDIRTNMRLKSETESTDVDIIALANDTLYLFECKHSMPPTGAHEIRDPWRDVQKGVSQLERAARILDRRGLAAYVPGWFPGVKADATSRLRLKSCVLCSHRVFAGLEIRGIPIRDALSLNLYLGDAVVRTAVPDGNGKGCLNVSPHRLRRSEAATVADLDNYLSRDAVYFLMFRPFMTAISRMDYSSPSLVVARETFVYQVPDGSWSDHLETLGAVRLPDETVTVGPARPGE